MFSAKIFGQRAGKKVAAKNKHILGASENENGSKDGSYEWPSSKVERGIL